MAFYLLAAITLLSAFLLFQIELIVGRLLLPHYGGSYWVWGSCVVFFQAVLLLGYVFCHQWVGRLGMIRYRWWHVALMLLPLLFFPGRELSIGDPSTASHLALDVFLRLTRTIGPVFFVLATMGVLSQIWLSSSTLRQRSNPYALYAVSNLGSFMALLSYPFVFEVIWGMESQTYIWRGLYFLLVLLVLGAVKYVPLDTSRPVTREEALPISWGKKWLWFLLGAGGVIVFLAVNNLITYEMAPLPLLWIWPLAIYLMAFVVCFKRKSWTPAWIMDYPDVWIGVGALAFLINQRRILPFAVELLLLLFLLFVLCVYCQGRLYRERPEDDANLTQFYVIMAFGGFVGGFVTSWILPVITKSPLEYFFGLAVIALTLSWDTKRQRLSPYMARLMMWFLIFIAVWPVVFDTYHFWGLLLLVWISLQFFKALSAFRYGVNLFLVILIVLWPSYEPFWFNDTALYKHRNYYGIYNIFQDEDHIRRLLNGTTLHGAQMRHRRWQDMPITYYSPSQPITILFDKGGFDFKRVGIVGLGVGSMAAFGVEGQQIDFYELDPDMYDMATEYFTFLERSKADIDVIFGDARQQLAQTERGPYDVFVVDAFGGDAIPFHLLNRDVVDLYRSRITPDGILVFHISNRYIDLRNVVAAISRDAGAYMAIGSSPRVEPFSEASRWIVLTWDEETRDKVLALDKWKTFSPSKNLRVWTDDYVDVLPAVGYEQLLKSFKHFKPFNW